MASNEYGSLFYNVDAIVAAQLESDGGYATPATVLAENTVEIEVNHDTDSNMSKGRRREMISVITHGTGKISQGVFDLPTLAQMTNSSESESGSTPNQTTNFDIDGGEDLPEFGLIFRLKSKQSAGGRFGMARCKLTKLPLFSVEQNQIVVPELEFEFWSQSDTVAKMLWIQIDETATALPTDSSGMDSFFGVS